MAKTPTDTDPNTDIAAETAPLWAGAGASDGVPPGVEAEGIGGDEVGVSPAKNGEGAVAGGVSVEVGEEAVVGDGDVAGEALLGNWVGDGAEAGDCAAIEDTKSAAITTTKKELAILEREREREITHSDH